MTLRFLSALGLTLLSIAAPVSADDETVQTLLQRMSRAVHGSDYVGVFVYRHSNRIDTMRLIHRADATGERERLVSLTGAPREVIRSGDDVACYLPDRRSVLVGHSHRRKPFPIALTNNPERLAPYYRFVMGEVDRTADRSAQIIEVQPKDGYRYGYRLWLDVESGLLLRSDLLNENGEVAEQVMFTEIHLDPDIADSDLESAVDSEGFVTIGPDAEDSAVLAFEPWLNPTLPDGFSVVSKRLRRIVSEAVQVEHFVLSDGLSTVSVFIDPEPSRDDMLQGLSQTGSVHAYGVYRDGRHVTVVGEVPAATVSLIGGAGKAEARGGGE